MLTIGMLCAKIWGGWEIDWVWVFSPLWITLLFYSFFVLAICLALGFFCLMMVGKSRGQDENIQNDMVQRVVSQFRQSARGSCDTDSDGNL